MALNFQENFTKPLTADLTEGRLKGPEDFALAIVKYYLDTVKDGMPVGVPPTLPAPGLNPIAPPPFNIGVSGVKVNPAKEQAMLSVLKAYFMAKDIELTKGAIDGLKGSITQTTNRFNQKKQEITKLVAQVKQASLELKNIPKYTKEIVEGVKEIIGEEKAKIKELQTFFSNLKEESKSLGVDEDKFKSIFQQELGLIESLKSFEIKNFSDFAKIPDLIKNTKQTITRLKGQAVMGTSTNSDTKFSDIKMYVADKLLEVALSFEELAKIVLNPPSFLSYVERLSKKNPKVIRLYRGMQKLDAVERFVKPEIQKLKIQIEGKKAEIQLYIQPKLDTIKQKLEDKVTELSVKVDSSLKTNLYMKATTKVKEFKENHAEYIKEKKKEVEIIQKIIKKTNTLVKQTVTLQKDLVAEFDGIKDELILFKEDVSASVSKYKDLSKEAKKQLADRAAQPLIPKKSEQTTPIDPLIPPSISTINPLELVQGYERRIDSTADLQRTRELRKNALKNQQKPGPTEDQVYTYMSKMGLGDFSKTALRIISESKTDLVTFKRLFEAKRKQFETYKLTIEDMVDEAQDLLKMLQELSNGKGPVGSKVAWAKTKGNQLKKSKVGRFATGVGISLMGLFLDLVTYLKPIIEKVKKLAIRLFEGIKAYVKNKTAKFEKDIESYLLNLIPLKGYIANKGADARVKKLVIDAKRRKAEDLVEQAKHYKNLATIIAKIAKGASGLSKNLITDKNYKFPANQRYVNEIVSGYFGYKKEQDGPSKQLESEEAAFRLKMQELATIDAFVTGFITLLKGVFDSLKSKGGFKEELDAFTLSLEQSGAPYAAGWNQLMSIFNTPIKDPKALGKAVISIVRDAEAVTKMAQAFQSLEVFGFLSRMETKYLGKTRELIKTYVDNPIGNDPNHRQAMEEWALCLDRNQSLVAFLLTKLTETTDRFFLFFNKQVKLFIAKQKVFIKAKLDAIVVAHEADLNKIKDKLINVESVFMGIALDLAARAFWTGTTWQGNTGTNHLTLNIGLFKKINILPEDGATGMAEMIAASFELQLKTMTGLVIPPPNTGIPPIPFQGYI